MQVNETSKQRLLAAQVARILVAAATLALAALGISARRAGLSLRAQFARVILLPLMFRRNRNDPAIFKARIAAERAHGPAQPSPALRTKFSVHFAAQAEQRAFTVAPHRNASSLRLLYLHGGAYVHVLRREHWGIIEGLIDRTGATTIVPIYPLAPEHDWQPAFVMIRAIYERLLHEVGSHNIVLVGDSAGGGLALALAQQFRDQGLPLPAALVLLSPFLDATVSDPVQVELARKDRMLSIAFIRRVAALWAGELPLDDPRISPLFGELAGLPPIAVFTGTDDILNADAHRLARRAAAANVALTLYEYRNEFHVWMGGFPRLIPEARRALDQAAACIRRHAAPTMCGMGDEPR